MPIVPRDVRTAVELLRREPARWGSIEGLAKACDVSRRTLEKHFREFLKRTPSEVRREACLDHARRALLRAEASIRVCDVAERFGFNHLGRFAATYRKRFGESPSATLRRRRSVTAPDVRSLTFAPPERDRPVVAICPFELSGSGAGEAATIADEISVALIRKRWLAVGSVENARYRLRGTVRGGEPHRLRAMVLLTDAATGRHLWADRWDGDVGELPAFVCRVADRVSVAIERAILAAEIHQATGMRLVSPGAWELAMRALPRALTIAPDAQAEAIETLEQAMELAPHDPLPVALAAWCRANRAAHFFTQQIDAERQSARELASRAARLNVDDPITEALIGATYTLGHDLEAATLHCDRALALDGSCVWAWNRRSLLDTYLGRADGAIERAALARKLGPHDPLLFGTSIAIGSGHFLAGRHEEAARWWTRCLAEHPAAVWINRFRSAAFALAGMKEAARQSFGDLMRAYPDLTVGDVRSSLPHPQSYIDAVCEALSGLGMPP